MTQGPALPRQTALAVALAFALAGCGSLTATPTPVPTPTQIAPTVLPPNATDVPRPPVEVYAEIRAAIVAIRGLQPTATVDPVTIDEAQMRTNLLAEFDVAQTATQLKDAQDLLGALGLLPKGSSLRELTSDLQAGQVAGYYSPERDELFIVNRTGSVGPVDEATYAHEFTHQLQDQNFDLGALGFDVADQSDRSLARLALVEGDATSAQTTWMIANLDAAELGELLRAALDPEALAALERAPAYLRDTTTFEYQDGLAFVSQLLTNGGYAAVDAAFADPPDSTEQILHPDKYVTHERPVDVTLPTVLFDGLGAGWIQAGQDTLGELLLRIWLNEGGIAADAARTATAGWGGDRLALLRNGGAVSVLVHTEWDTAGDADEFALAATTAVGKVAPGGRIVHAPGSKAVWILIGDGAMSIYSAIAAQ